MASYIFGGDTGETRESLERRREFARRMLEGSTSQMPNTVGEGIAALGMALSGRWGMNAVNKEEASKREAASSEYAKNLPFWLQSSMGGASAPSAPSSSPSQPTRSSAPSMAPQQAPQGKEEFISMMMPAALQASERTGIDPRLIIAQAAQETGWGKSAPGNNYFGIKSHGQGGGQNLATHEYVDGKRVNVNANFRQYGSPTESALGYADFLLSNPRYQPMLNAEGLDAQLAALGQSGYATDPNYAQSVGSIARGISLPPEMAGNQAPLAIEAATTGNPHLDAFGADMGQRQRAAQKMKTALTYAPRQDLRDAPLNMSAEDAMQTQPDRQLPGKPQDYVRPAANQPGMAPQPYAPPAPAPQPPQPPFNPLMQRRDQLAQQTGSQQIAQADPTKGFLAAILGGGQGGQPSGGEFPSAPSPDGLDAMRGPQLPFDPAMLELANNPFLPEGQRAVLQAMIQQQMQAADPMRRLEMQRAQLELEQLRNPDPRDIINAGDGRLYNPNTGEWITAPGANSPSSRPMTREERQTWGIPDDGTPWAMTPDGPEPLIDSPLVENNVGNGNKFVEESGKAAASRLNDIVVSGSEAATFMGDLEALRGIATQINTGKGAQVTAALGPYAEALGIDIEGLGEMQAYEAIIARMAPQMRPPGSGASSDFDARQFLYSLPSLGNTPRGNQIIIQTFEALQNHKLRAAEIASQAFIPQEQGGITWQEAERQIRELGNPYDAFNKYKKAVNSGTQGEAQRPADVPQELWDVMTPEERALWQ